MSIAAIDNRSCSRTEPTPPCSISLLDRSSTPVAGHFGGDQKCEKDTRVVDTNGSDRVKDFGGDACSSSSSSSIGQNSDEVGGGSEEESEEEEVDSRPLRPKTKAKRDQSFNNLDELQDCLPFRKGISRFYNGKSKSFASLSDATAVPSIEDIAKPENAYSRRKRSLLAYSLLYENNTNSNSLRRGASLLKISQGGGISKRQAIDSPRSTLALAVLMGGTDSDVRGSSTATPTNATPLDINVDSGSKVPDTTFGTFMSPSSGSGGSKSNFGLLPSSLVQRNMHPWRSFSVMDLQQCANANGGAPICGSSCLPSSSVNDRKKSDKVSWAFGT